MLHKHPEFRHEVRRRYEELSPGMPKSVLAHAIAEFADADRSAPWQLAAQCVSD